VVAKARANDFPISAHSGRRDPMEMIASNPGAARWDLQRRRHVGGGRASDHARVLRVVGIHARTHALGRCLMTGLREAARRHGHRLVAQGPGSVFFAWFLDHGEVASYRNHLRADAGAYARFAALMLDEGVRLIPAGAVIPAAAHDERPVDRTLETADCASARLKP
jgi:glutamate-1-semialdehyde aminotransferase